jgi:hypothetical protein
MISNSDTVSRHPSIRSPVRASAVAAHSLSYQGDERAPAVRARQTVPFPRVDDHISRRPAAHGLLDVPVVVGSRNGYFA